AEERHPLLVVIDERAQVTVLRFERAPMKEPAVSRSAARRIEAATAQVIAEHELRQRFEHWKLHFLRFAGPFPTEQRGENGVHCVHPDDAIGEIGGNVRRTASSGLLEQRRERARALDEVVVRGAARIWTRAAEPQQASVD